MRHAQFLYICTELCAISLQKDVICMSTLGERLKNARIQRRFTQDQLAIYMNITRSTISNWERGICEPDFEALQQLSTLLHTNFLTDSDENTVNQEEISRKITLNASKSPVVEFISHSNACIFSEITVDCSVNCVDQHGNALKFRLFVPFCIESTVE